MPSSARLAWTTKPLLSLAVVLICFIFIPSTYNHLMCYVLTNVLSMTRVLGSKTLTVIHWTLTWWLARVRRPINVFWFNQTCGCSESCLTGLLGVCWPSCVHLILVVPSCLSLVLSHFPLVLLAGREGSAGKRTCFSSPLCFLSWEFAYRVSRFQIYSSKVVCST